MKARKLVTLVLALVLVLVCGIQIAAEAVPTAATSSCPPHDYEYYILDTSRAYNDSTTHHRYYQMVRFYCRVCELIEDKQFSYIEPHNFEYLETIPYPDGACDRYQCTECGCNKDYYVG